MRAETPTSLVNQMSATRPHARTNSYFQDEDTGRFTSEVISKLPKGASLGYGDLLQPHGMTERSLLHVPISMEHWETRVRRRA